MATRNNDRIRYRYGICLNDNCEKCKTKEVQEVPARKEFVCQNPECGKPLRECPPPKKGGNGKLFGIIAGAVVLLAIIGGVIVFSGSGKETPKPEPVAVASVDSDSIKAAKMAEENQKLKDSLAAVELANANKQEKAEFHRLEYVAVTRAGQAVIFMDVIKKSHYDYKRYKHYKSILISIIRQIIFIFYCRFNAILFCCLNVSVSI
jgi:hypothetical protein